MNQQLPCRTILLLLLAGLCFSFGAPRAAAVVEIYSSSKGGEDATELYSSPKAEDTAETSSLTVELSQVAEELCGQALFNFKPMDVPPASLPPILAALIPKKNEDEAAANPKDAKIAVTRTGNKELNQALSDFVNSVKLAGDEKIEKISQEVVVEKKSGLGLILKLATIHGEMKKTLNDKNSPPFSDDDMNDFISMVSDFFSPIKIVRGGNNFGPEDYCLKATFKTSKRKFRLNLIKHGENYLWFVEDVI